MSEKAKPGVEFDINATVVPREEVFAHDEVRVAMLTFTRSGDITLNWLPLLFADGVLTNDLRQAIVEVLRLHADKLESKEMDARMAQVTHGASDEVH